MMLNHSPLFTHVHNAYVCVCVSHRHHYHHQIEWKPQWGEIMVESALQVLRRPRREKNNNNIEYNSKAWIAYIVFVGIVHRTRLFFFFLSLFIFLSQHMMAALSQAHWVTYIIIPKTNENVDGALCIMLKSRLRTSYRMRMMLSVCSFNR